MLDRLSLDGKTIIITGGGTGLGLAMVRALARAGADLAIAGRRPGPIDDAASEVVALGRDAIAMPTDVTDSAQVDRLIATTIDHFGQVDVLINNAGAVQENVSKPLWDITDDEWHMVMDVNLTGPFYCSRAVSRPMSERGKGKIINISSTTINVGTPLLLHYVASKGAVWSLTRALARELAGTGINVNAVTPGYTMTESALSIADPETIAGLKEELLKMQIVKRHEEPSDLAGTIVFLASDASDFITGQTINVDGGTAHY